MTIAGPVVAVLEAIEREACRDIFASAPAAWTASAGLRHERLGAADLFLLAAVPIGHFNRLVGLGVEAPASEAMLDTTLARFAAAGIKDFFIHLSPGAQPAALPGWLAARGLVPSRRAWAKFWRDDSLPPVNSTTLRIAEVGPDRAADFALAACEGLGLPPSLRPWRAALVGRPGWRTYVAYDGTVPAASGALYCRDGVAWLGVGATIPAYRRRGVQGALISRRIADAIAAGCRDIAAETSEPAPGEPNPAHANMLRTGFRVVYSRPNYVLAPPA
jgi:GNAT superfamily N-acetyltransferase